MSEGMSAHHGSVNRDIKMQHLPNFETSAALLRSEIRGR
jgi:hypothetical protein